MASALTRSREARAEHPELAAQAARWGISGAAAWLAACRLRPGLPLARGLAWWACVWQMLDWHLAMAEGGDGVPRERLAAADALTLVRFWLVPALPALRVDCAGLPLVIALGGATDWLDGTLARRSGRTRLGRDLDTTADLVFVSVAAAAALRAGRLSQLAARMVLVRHSAGLALALVAVFGRARRPAVRARRWGALLRLGGLIASTAGAQRAGELLLLAGCLVPPRSTAPHLSRA